MRIQNATLGFIISGTGKILLSAKETAGIKSKTAQNNADIYPVLTEVDKNDFKRTSPQRRKSDQKISLQNALLNPEIDAQLSYLQYKKSADLWIMTCVLRTYL